MGEGGKVSVEWDDLRDLIWRLDLALNGLEGLDWIKSAGDIARLKEKYLGLGKRSPRPRDIMSLSDFTRLDLQVGLLSLGSGPVRGRRAALKAAIRQIGEILAEIE